MCLLICCLRVHCSCTGYPLEVHEVVTHDGYLLRMERIPQHAATDAVFMMHGTPQALHAHSSDRTVLHIAWCAHAAGLSAAYECSEG